MLFGIRGHDLGQRKADEAFASLKARGYECVQLVLHKLIPGFSSYEDDFPAELLEVLRSSAELLNFEIALTGCYQDLANPECEALNLRLYAKYAAIARTLGSHYVGTESAQLAQYLDVCEARRGQLLSIVPKVCALMAEQGMALLLEPVGLQPLNKPELCAELMKTCPQGSLKFVFDPANILIPEQADQQPELWKRWFDCTAFTDAVVMVHFKDYVPGKGFERIMRPLNQGLVDFDLLKPYIRSLPNLQYALREGQDPDFAALDLKFMHDYFA